MMVLIMLNLRKKSAGSAGCLFSLILMSCGGGSTNSIEVIDEKQSLYYDYDFSESEQGFVIDIADYQIDHPLNQSITAELSKLPPPYEYRRGIQYSWDNYNQDIKGFIKLKLKDINPNKQFNVEFTVSILTFMSEECLGIAGSPGKDVTVKAGILEKEPSKFVVDDGLSKTYRIDIDDELYGGEDTTYLGHIGLPITCDDNFFDNKFIWEIKSLTHDEEVSFVSTSGEVWYYISIDSGVGGNTQVYIMDVAIKLDEI